MKLQLPTTVLFLFAVLFLVGCGPKGPAVNYVEGIVTYDGKPLHKASIFFHPKGEVGERPAVGITDIQGKYKLTTMGGGAVGKGATTGDYIVTILRYEDLPIKPDGDIFASMIPERYTLEKTSPLTFTVGPRKNRFDIDIEKK